MFIFDNAKKHHWELTTICLKNTVLEHSKWRNKKFIQPLRLVLFYNKINIFNNKNVIRFSIVTRYRFPSQLTSMAFFGHVPSFSSLYFKNMYFSYLNFSISVSIVIKVIFYGPIRTLQPQNWYKFWWITQWKTKRFSLAMSYNVWKDVNEDEDENFCKRK
jgi:hypothetical protein